MYGILIGALFLVPIYYRSKAKGFDPGWFTGVAAALGLGAFGVGMISPSPWIGLLCVGLPGVVLLIVRLAPARAGAPGADSLELCFACPECGDRITFPRHREGSGQFCPACGEVITVPADPRAKPAGPRPRRAPSRAEGVVVFESFGRPEPAHQLAGFLTYRGIRSFVSGDDAGGLLPQVGNTEGYRVLINAEDWERAADARDHRRTGS